MSKAPSPANAPARIARHLQRITHQHFFRSFEDWLALSVNAFLRDDEAYMAIMGKYGPRTAPMGELDHPADHFARALGEWMLAMKLEPADYLGRVYEEQALANNYAGQFFTPEPVTALMASLTMPDDIADTAIVCDPACGSGRMLVEGIRRNRFATFVGVDTDLTCVHMTALNCLVRNATTYVIHDNSLSLEAWRGYTVRRSPVGGELHRLSAEQALTVLQAPFAKPETVTALTPAEPSAPAVREPTPEAKAAIDAVAKQFTVDKRGQGEFGF